MIEFREWADENCFQSKDAYMGAEQAWDYKQDKIDEMKKQVNDIKRKLQSVGNDEIRPRHSEYDRGWFDCSITVLRDLEEMLK